MILHLTQLPDRLAPAVLAIPGTTLEVRFSGNVLGIGNTLTGAVVRPMAPVFDEPFYNADNSVSVAGGRIVVGAGIGGGPRCVIVDPDTGIITHSVYVGDPNSRAGCDAGAIASLIGAVQGVPVSIAPLPVGWVPASPNSLGWGPIRVELVPAGWVGDDNEAFGLLADTFGEIWDMGGDGYEYTIGWGLKDPVINVELLPGMTAADVAEEIINGD